MDGRQRRTVNFFTRYVIDDKAVQTAASKEADKDAQLQSQSSVVTDKLRVVGQDRRELFEKLDLREGKWDRRLMYEVTGIKIDKDQFGDSLDEESSSNKSVNDSNNGASDNQLLKVGDKNVYTPRKRNSWTPRATQLKQSKEINLGELNNLLESFMIDGKSNDSDEESKPKEKEEVQTAINQ